MMDGSTYDVIIHVALIISDGWVTAMKELILGEK